MIIKVWAPNPLNGGPTTADERWKFDVAAMAKHLRDNPGLHIERHEDHGLVKRAESGELELLSVFKLGSDAATADHLVAFEADARKAAP